MSTFLQTIFQATQRLVLSLLILILGVIGLSMSAFAAEPIRVSVAAVDEKGQPVALAEAQIKAGEKVIGKATTDTSGKAAIELERAGEYTLSVQKKGYLANETSIQLSAGQGPQQIDLVLSHASLSEQKVEVQATASSPVAEASASTASLDMKQAAQSASKPATLSESLPLVPGVIRGPNGTVQIAGAGENHSALLVNSVDVTDPATGAFGLSIPIDTVETLSVAEMPYLAQYGRFTAGVVSAETRRGGDNWDFSLNDPFPDFRIRSAHLQGVRDASPRFNVSGPLISDKLFFSEGIEYLLYKQEVLTLPFPSNETRSEAVNSFTQMDAILNPNQTLTASFHFAPHNLNYVGLNYFNQQPTTPNADLQEYTGTLIHRWGFGGGVLQSTIATTDNASDVKPQIPGDMILNPLGNQGSYFSQQTRGANRFQWIENWTPRNLHFAGTHTFQIGSVIARSENEGDFHASPVMLQDTDGQVIQRIDYSGGAPFSITDIAPAGYVQDHWMLNNKVAIDAGVRLESQSVTHTFRAAPRAGFSWSPNASSRTVIRGGAGVFYDYVPLNVYAFNNYPQQAVTNYDSTGAVIGLPVTYLNLTQQAASRFPLIDRDNTNSGNFAPYSIAWNLEVERSVMRQIVVRLKYLHSEANDLITLTPELLSGQNAMVLGSSGWAHTRQIEFTTKIGSETKKQFFFSYVRQYARGTITDATNFLGNYPFPVVRQGIVGSSSSEVPNRFLLWGAYALPKQISVMPKIEYRDGFPYQPVDVYQQYVDLAGPQPRFPRYFSLDMRVSKEVQVGKHAVRFSVSALNLTNHFNALDVHANTADPLYGYFFGNYHRHFLLDFDFLH
jgi:Carboxypeptidase regulatory-like domain/TonB-dependent Receptor Plug Domain